jgi:Protein of unknown function DUF72
MSRAGEVRIGISGWNYGGWRGTFYPRGLRHSDELSYASRQVDTIEINGTHYSLQRPESFAHWYDETPESFIFAVKGSRYITHLKQLKDIEGPLANFFASGVLRLEEKLGPFLWQFSPRFKFDPSRLEPFFSLLPRDSEAAAALAKAHDRRLSGNCVTQSRSATRAFSIPPSSRCCGGMRSRSSSPIPWNGRTAKTSPLTLFMSAYTAPKSSTRVAIPMRRSIGGQCGSSSGRGGSSPTMRG